MVIVGQFSNFLLLKNQFQNIQFLFNREHFKTSLDHSTAMFMQCKSHKININMVEYHIKIVTWNVAF